MLVGTAFVVATLADAAATLAFAAAGLLALWVVSGLVLHALSGRRGGAARWEVLLRALRALVFATLAVATVLVLLELRARDIPLPCVVWLPVPVCVALAWISLLRPPPARNEGGEDSDSQAAKD